MRKKTLNWGEKRYVSSYKDDRFMNTPIGKERKIDSNYKYITKNPFKRFIYWILNYLIAYPVLGIMLKVKHGVKVYGKKNIRKLKGGAILIGNHTQPLDCGIVSVNVAFPKRNYIVCNKEAVEVTLGRFFTTALGALPLPDDLKGLHNLSNTIDELVKKGKTVTIFPEAAIWPYNTMLRPLPSANFHYAVKSNVPVVPFCVTYRYAKGKNYLNKKPKIDVHILEPIYPDTALKPSEAKMKLAEQTEAAMKAVIETPNNVALYEYVLTSDGQDGKVN